METSSGPNGTSDVVTYYGRIPDASSAASNPLLCVYVSYEYRSAEQNAWIEWQQDSDRLQRFIAAMPSRLSDFGSPTEQTVRAVINTAEKRCSNDKSAEVCAGLAPGTDPQIVKARLEVIRDFVNPEFASKFGRRDTANLGKVWRVLNKLLRAMASSKP